MESMVVKVKEAARSGEEPKKVSDKQKQKILIWSQEK